MQNNRKRKHKPIEKGSCVSVYLSKKASDTLVEWLNSQTELGPTILRILEQHVSGEFIHISNLQKLLGESEQRIISKHHSPMAQYEQEVEMKRQKTIAEEPTFNNTSPEQRQERGYDKENEEVFEKVEREDTKVVHSPEIEEEEIEETDPEDIIIEEDNPFEEKEKKQEERPKRKMPSISPSWDINR